MMNFFKNKKHNVIVLGCDGMFGHDMYQELRMESMRKNSNIGIVFGIRKEDGVKFDSRSDLDAIFDKSVHFDYCINCIAHTDTKAAETTDDGAILDYELNALAPKYIAESCKDHKVKLIHISTDYVFSEKTYSKRHGEMNKKTLLFDSDDEPFPLNVYGKNKLLGEMHIKQTYGENSKDYAILRTSWLYGMHNSKSFIHKFLKNVTQKLKEDPNAKIGVTTNEISIPTSTAFLIYSVMITITYGHHGVVHAVPPTESFDGVSRIEFAQCILDCLAEHCEYYGDDVLKVNGVDLTKVKLEPIANMGHNPNWSAMRHDFGPYRMWNDDLSHFINLNCEKLVEYIKTCEASIHDVHV